MDREYAALGGYRELKRLFRHLRNARKSTVGPRTLERLMDALLGKESGEER